MYKSGKVFQRIRNHTICVLTKSGIRPMTANTDIEEKLVWINQAIPETNECVSAYIECDEYVRYLDIQVVPKFTVDKY